MWPLCRDQQVSRWEPTWADVRASEAAESGDEAARACHLAERLGFKTSEISAFARPERNRRGIRIPFAIYFGDWRAGEMLSIVTAEGVTTL